MVDVLFVGVVVCLVSVVLLVGLRVWRPSGAADEFGAMSDDIVDRLWGLGIECERLRPAAWFDGGGAAGD